MSAGINLDEIVFSTGAGAVDSDTMRVHLSDESLAALEDINVTVTDIDLSSNVAIKNTAETVTTTAAQVVSTSLANRKEITIQNEGTQSVYIGVDNTVTAANGIKISKNSSATYAWGPNIQIWMIAASGSQDVRILESA